MTIERPKRDEKGNIIYKNGSKTADNNLRDTEDIPLEEDIEKYFEREILPFNPDAWMDRKKIRLVMRYPLQDYFINLHHQKLQKLLRNVLKIRRIHCCKLSSIVRKDVENID